MGKEKKTTRLGGKLRLMLRTIYSLHVPVYAANASYFIILAIFPALLLLLSLLRYTPLKYEYLIAILDGIVPETLMASVSRVIYSVYESSSTTLVSVSAVVALWSASRGIYGVLVGLNKVYGVREDRGYLYTRTISIFYTFLFIIVLLATLALHVFGQTILSYIPKSSNPALQFLLDLIPIRFFLLLAMQTALFTGMFMIFPNRKNHFLTSLPGALFASLGWLVFSDLFSKYVAIFGDSSAIYGSVTSIALAMLWLYICMSIVFYGGGINRYLMDIGFQIKTRRARKRIAEARAAQAEREEQEAEPAPDAEKKQEGI